MISVGKIPWRRERLATPGFWPGEFHGLYRPWTSKESDMTEQLSLTHSSAQGLQSLHIIIIIICLLVLEILWGFCVSFFKSNQPNGCEVVPHTVVLICIYLIISDTAHLFMCLSAIDKPLKKMSVQVLNAFLIGCLL